MISEKVLLFLFVGCLISFSGLAQPYKQSNKTYLYLYVDKLPKFPGGSDSLKLFLKANLKWPDNNMDAQGTVVLSIIISTAGNVTHIKIEKSLSKAFDDEAKRVVKLMPKWVPGKVGNSNVDVKLYFPIDFFIAD